MVSDERTTMNCSVCGAANEAGAVFCYQCGSRLRQADASPAPTTGPTVDLSRGSRGSEYADTPAPSSLDEFGHGSSDQTTTDDLQPLLAREEPRARTYAEPPARSDPFGGGFGEPAPQLPAAPAPSSARVYQVPSNPSGQPYVVGPITPSTRTSTLATIALVLGVISWFLVPFIAAIGAIILGHMARTEIRRSAGQVSGDGLALAGLILGYLNVGLIGLGILAFCLLVPMLGMAFS
jgi:hypothetical protein